MAMSYEMADANAPPNSPGACCWTTCAPADAIPQRATNCLDGNETFNNATDA